MTNIIELNYAQTGESKKQMLWHERYAGKSVCGKE
jgi:hypothetical protein